MKDTSPIVFKAFNDEIINFTQVQRIKRQTNESCFDSKMGPDGKMIKTVIGFPYEIIFELPVGIPMRFSYKTQDEQEQNWDLLIDITHSR